MGAFDIGVYASEHFLEHYPVYPKANGVYKIIIDGISIVHLGDAHGSMSNKLQLIDLKEKLGPIDLLLMPIGDGNLVNLGKTVWTNTIEILEPKVIVPMHYWSLEDKAAFLEYYEKKEFKVLDFDQSNTFSKSLLKTSTPKPIIWNISPVGNDDVE